MVRQARERRPHLESTTLSLLDGASDILGTITFPRLVYLASLTVDVVDVRRGSNAKARPSIENPSLLPLSSVQFIQCLIGIFTSCGPELASLLDSITAPPTRSNPSLSPHLLSARPASSARAAPPSQSPLLPGATPPPRLVRVPAAQFCRCASFSRLEGRWRWGDGRGERSGNAGMDAA